MSDLLAKDLSIWLHDSVPVKPEAIFFLRFCSDFTQTTSLLSCLLY